MSNGCRFLKQIERETPKGFDIHLIADNYATHKHPKVKAWLAKRPRFKMHFTPTSSSWLNLVERFFRDLTEDVIRSGSFASVQELVDDINAYLAERNANPRPYKWTAKGEAILEKIHRARAAQNTQTSQGGAPRLYANVTRPGGVGLAQGARRPKKGRKGAWRRVCNCGSSKP